MQVPVLLRAEVTFGFHRLTTLRADGASAVDHVCAPACQFAYLVAGGPKADLRGGFGVFLFGQQFLGEDDHAVAFLVVAQADLACAEERVNGWVDPHLCFNEFPIRFFETRVLTMDLREELFDADGKRLKLGFFDQDGDGALVLIGLQVKDALTGGANGVGSDMVTGVYIDFKAGHRSTFGDRLPKSPKTSEIYS